MTIGSKDIMINNFASGILSIVSIFSSIKDNANNAQSINLDNCIISIFLKPLFSS
jgi:hypothetical protein